MSQFSNKIHETIKCFMMEVGVYAMKILIHNNALFNEYFNM